MYREEGTNLNEFRKKIYWIHRYGNVKISPGWEGYPIRKSDWLFESQTSSDSILSDKSGWFLNMNYY